MRIYLDESGFTGEDLFNEAQPIFVLASTVLADNESRRIQADIFGDVHARELKHSAMAKTAKGRSQVLNFVRALRMSKGTSATYVLHKKFCLLAKLVDLYLEAAMHQTGFDLYKGGANLAFTNVCYYCLGSQSGLVDGFHAFTSASCRRFFSACRARASGLCPAIRPIFASSMRFSLDKVTPHEAQYCRPVSIGTPQTRHTAGGRAASCAGVSTDISLAARRWPCVSRVAGKNCRAGFGLVAQSARTTLSAIGAMARAQIGAVSERRTANGAISRQLPSRSSKNHSRRNGSRVIGTAYHHLKENQKALDYYNQALRIEQAAGFRGLEANTLNNIGTAYDGLGEKQKALDYFNQALVLRHAVGDRRGEGTALLNLGNEHHKLGDKQQGLAYYGQALPLFRAVQDPADEAKVFVALMYHWKGLENPQLAILFGKLAVDRFQQLRGNIRGLERADRQSFLDSIQNNYRQLADLLVSQGRLPEALQVVDMLKLEEYSEYTRHRGKSSSETTSPAYTPPENKAKGDYAEATASAVADGREWTELHAKRSRTAAEEQKYNELSAKLAADTRQFQSFLENLYNNFGKGSQGNARVTEVREVTSGLEKSLADFGPGAVGLSTVVLDDKLDIIVVTPAVTVAREVPIQKRALRSKVYDFINAMAVRPVSAGTMASSDDRGANLLPKASDLYKVLISPIEKDLEDSRAKTLVWQLDDVLHYLPLAALYDGNHYLVERFQNVVITTSSLTDVKDQPQVSAWRGLAMGVSKDFDGLGELTAVPEELAAVVHSDSVPGSHGPVAGSILLDDLFTEKAMASNLEGHPPLVHIGSHFVFNPGDDTQSYLLLGGKDTGGQGFRLTLAELRDDPRLDFRGIELLTLAGCQTGVSLQREASGVEIDGLGITAHDKGAKAVLATLWAIDDPSVALLMAKFYQRLTSAQTKTTKAEALQQAQLALLHGADAPAKTSAAPPYADPYYWAPFILIGNWK